MSVTIISVGNGGFNIASDIIKAGIFPEHQFIVVDTDKEQLEKNAEYAGKSILFEKFGRGKVKSALTGLVDEVLDETSDTIIVCTTLGGKTGTKYAPLISLNAILRGKFVCNVFSMPYKFEGTAKNNLASTAWQLMMCTANLTFQQYNDGLEHVENLMMGEMDKPLVDTISNTLSCHTVQELSQMNNKQLMDLIPKEYQLQGIPLIRIVGDAYLKITEAERKQLFDDLA